MYDLLISIQGRWCVYYKVSSWCVSYEIWLFVYDLGYQYSGKVVVYYKVSSWCVQQLAHIDFSPSSYIKQDASSQKVFFCNMHTYCTVLSAYVAHKKFPKMYLIYEKNIKMIIF